MTCHSKGSDTMPTTETVTTPSVTVANGDRLTIISTDGYHGFAIGTTVRVIPDSTNSATEWLVTTRDHDSTEWESGVCAWVNPDNVTPFIPAPGAVKIGDALVVTRTGTHGFPVGSLGRVAAIDTDLTGKTHWKMTTRNDLGDLSWEHGVCAWVNVDNAEGLVTPTLPVKDTTPDDVTPDVVDDETPTLSIDTDMGETPKKGYRYELTVPVGGFEAGCIVTVTGNYFGASDMEVTDMVDFEAACARGWSFSWEPGNIVRNVYYSDVRRVAGEVEFETFTDKDVVTVEVTVEVTPDPVVDDKPVITYNVGDKVAVLFDTYEGPNGVRGWDLIVPDFTPGMTATVVEVGIIGSLRVEFDNSSGTRQYVKPSQIEPWVEPDPVPVVHTYVDGDQVAVLFDGTLNDDGTMSGYGLYIEDFVPGMKATVSHLCGELAVSFPGQGTKYVKPAQIAPWVDPIVEPTVEDDQVVETAKALTASRTQALLDFQNKVRAVILDTDGLDDQDADDMLDRLGLASRWPVGFPSTKQSIVKLTSGNIAVRADYDWFVLSLTGEGVIYSGYSDAETAKEFDSLIYKAP